MAAELSDAEVFGTGQREWTDAEVFGIPAVQQLTGVAPGAPLADVLASPEAQGADVPGGQANPSSGVTIPTIAEARQVLEPPEGWRTNSILPVAIREKQTPGQPMQDIRWDWGPLRALGQPFLDLLEGTGQATSMGPGGGPRAGRVTPEGTMLLLGGAMGRSTPTLRGALRASERPPEPIPSTGGRWTNLAGREAPLSPEFQAAPVAPQPLAADLPAAPTSPTGIPAPEANVFAPKVEAPAEPQPAGAQWSGGNQIVGITPAEEAAYRVNAEGQKLIEPQPIGVPDRNAYVEGVNPNLVEQEQQVHTARELKGLQIRSDDASQEAKQIAAEHNQARTIHLNNTVKAETDILRRSTQRERDINQDKATILAPSNIKGPVDHQPIVERIREILNAPENRQDDAVQSVLRPLLDRLENTDGTAKITDATEMWGLRRLIDRWTSTRMQSEDLNLHYAGRQLSQVSNVIDQQIERVAPGYDAMIARYAEHSRAIGAMRVLQDEAKKVYVSGGGTMRMTFEGVQRMMKHIVDMRDADPTNLNPYKNISEAEMQRLWALRDDLRRSASAVELAKTPGSDTAQNVWDMMKGMATGPEAQQALHAFAATHFGIPGYVVSRAAGSVIGALRGGATVARDTARAQEMLRPQTPLTNPFAPP